ncbi:MAG: glycosyltransferase [Gammaproteobacteria bacterium]|nr:glycosyltransferase [Gammaproteobacteria bacterium]
MDEAVPSSIPRTLIVDLAHRFGGASARAIAILRKLSPQRAALAALHQSPVAALAHSDGLEVHTVGRHKADPRIPGRLIRLIRDGGFGVLDTQNPQANLWGAFAGLRTHSALVTTLNSWPVSEHRGNIKGHLYALLVRALSRHTHLHVVVSDEIRRQLLAAGVAEEAIVLIRNGVAITADNAASDERWLHDAQNLPDHAVVACCVGRLVEAKGHRYLVAAIARLADSCQRLHCVLIGDGHLRSQLRRQIRTLGLERRVHIVGDLTHQDTLSAIKSSDFFVMPSLSEGTPIALLEAAALGRPIIATRVGGIPDVVTEGKQAMLVDPGDPGALAEAIDWIYNHRPQAQMLGRCAQARVNDEFSLESQINELQRVYQHAWLRSQRT